MTSLIKVKSKFDEFVHAVLPELRQDEVYFVSLSARNKYLTDEERVYYGLGRTEMFARTLVASSDSWDYAMEKLAANLSYRKTKNGSVYPEHAIVVYVNINPSSSVKACIEFNKVVQNIQGEMLKSVLAGKNPDTSQLLRADRLLLNEFQKATGTRHYLDIDIDAPEHYRETIQSHLTNLLFVNDVEHHLVKTRGGYHILINRNSLNKSKFRLHEEVQAANKVAKECGGEVLFNSNAMIPAPGTSQGGKIVELVY